MKKSTLLIVLVVLVSVFVYYRYAKEVFQVKQEDVLLKERFDGSVAYDLRGVSAEASYTVPGDSVDALRFVVTVDEQGVIQGIQTLDAETGEIPEKKKEFNDQINVILKGKKLSELSAIDKVGKSSLTTNAFNEALPKLQAAL